VNARPSSPFPGDWGINVVRGKELILSECTSLISLPTEIGQLTSLKVLDLRVCISLPEEIGELKSLKYLYLRECTSLISLPEEIGERCTSLKGSDAVITALKKNACKVFHD